MMETFTLKIKLDNDAIQETFKISKAVEQAAKKLELGFTVGDIKDENGNAVGFFRLE